MEVLGFDLFGEMACVGPHREIDAFGIAARYPDQLDRHPVQCSAQTVSHIADDFTDVRDVVRAYRLLVERGEPGEAYNVCSGQDIAISELAERLIAMADRPMRLELDAGLQRPVDVPVLRGDFTKLNKATGWQPELSLDDTLRDVLAEWRAIVWNDR